MKTKKVYKIALFGLLSAISVILNIFDTILSSSIAFLPMGARLGLSNLALCVAASQSFFGAFAVCLVKVIFIFVSRGATAAIMSFFGSMLSTLSLVLLLFLKRKNSFFVAHLSFIGISLIGAVIHNISQLVCSAFITGSVYILYYYKFMLLFALISGTITGIMLNIIMPRIEKSISRHSII